MKDGKGQAELGAPVLGEGPSCCWWEGDGSYVASTPPGTIETSSCCSCFSFLCFFLETYLHTHAKQGSGASLAANNPSQSRPCC